MIPQRMQDLLSDDNSPRAQEPARIGGRGERIDAYMCALGGRVNEAFVVNGDADVQLLVREVHEDQIALMHFVARDRRTGVQLFVRGARNANTGAVRRIHHQPAAVESAGRGTAPAIRLAEHGLGAIDHDDAGIRRWARDAGGVRRAGGAVRIRRVAVFYRGARACAQRDRQSGYERGSDHTRVVANAAPTMPASERKVPTHNRASQCSLSKNFSGSSVMPPHSTMRSGPSKTCISSI